MVAYVAPLKIFLAALAGWLSGREQDLIEYLLEENRVLRTQLRGRRLAVNGVAALLLITEGRGLLPTLFETVSAAGTVGLSTGEAGAPVSLAGHFSPFGKLLVIVTMYMGRIGPLTLAVAVARSA